MPQRPSGLPLMHQSWGKLLFIHWPIEESTLRALIPANLEIEKFDGTPWIGVVPFTMWDIRPFPPYAPRVPYLNAMHELNVRTYVSFEGDPGVWFLSLDCNNAAAVFGARKFYYLPYFNAEIALTETHEKIDYQLQRTDEPAANFSAAWTIGSPLPPTTPGTLDFFLTERYCLYSAHNDKLYRSRIFHEQWSLRSATLNHVSSSMIESHGLPTRSGDPLIHYAEEISVDIWALKRVAG